MTVGRAGEGRGTSLSATKSVLVVVPGFIANAGGVICAPVEYRGGTAPQALAMVEEQMRGNTLEVFGEIQGEGILPRKPGERMALDRIRKA